MRQESGKAPQGGMVKKSFSAMRLWQSLCVVLVVGLGFLAAHSLSLEPGPAQRTKAHTPLVGHVSDPQAALDESTKLSELYRDHEFSFETPVNYTLAHEGHGGLHLVPDDHDPLGRAAEMFVRVIPNDRRLDLRDFLAQTQCGTEVGMPKNPLEAKQFVNAVHQNVLFSREFCGFHYLDRYLVADKDAVLVVSAHYFEDGDPVQDDTRSVADTLAPLDIHGRRYPEL